MFDIPRGRPKPEPATFLELLLPTDEATLCVRVREADRGRGGSLGGDNAGGRTELSVASDTSVPFDDRWRSFTPDHAGDCVELWLCDGVVAPAVEALSAAAAAAAAVREARCSEALRALTIQAGFVPTPLPSGRQTLFVLCESD
jgi:hypothetical protein